MKYAIPYGLVAGRVPDKTIAIAFDVSRQAVVKARRRRSIEALPARQPRSRRSVFRRVAVCACGELHVRHATPFCSKCSTRISNISNRYAVRARSSDDAMEIYFSMLLRRALLHRRATRRGAP